MNFKVTSEPSHDAISKLAADLKQIPSKYVGEFMVGRFADDYKKLKGLMVALDKFDKSEVSVLLRYRLDVPILDVVTPPWSELIKLNLQIQQNFQAEKYNEVIEQLKLVEVRIMNMSVSLEVWMVELGLEIEGLSLNLEENSEVIMNVSKLEKIENYLNLFLSKIEFLNKSVTVGDFKVKLFFLSYASLLVNFLNDEDLRCSLSVDSEQDLKIVWKEISYALLYINIANKLSCFLPDTVANFRVVTKH